MKFTIAIPAYKSLFLSKCIQSILNQDFKDFELIIVNDASPENLDNIIEEFTDKRIQYFKNDKNFGVENVVDNWNKCLSLAKGDYFILMGDDDEMMVNYLSSFNELIIKFPDLDVYHCRSYIIDEDSKIKDLTPSWPNIESVYENIWHRMKELRSQYISDFVYNRKKLLDRGGFYKLPAAWASDDITSFEMAAKKGIAHTQEPVFCYRKSSVTISNSGFIQIKFKGIEGEEKWYDLFLKKQPNNELDFIFYKSILANKKNYFTKKRITTIAYNGIRKKHLIKDLLHFTFKRKYYKMNLFHIFYAFILSIKKMILEK